MFRTKSDGFHTKNDGFHAKNDGFHSGPILLTLGALAAVENHRLGDPRNMLLGADSDVLLLELRKHRAHMQSPPPHPLASLRGLAPRTRTYMSRLID